MKHKVTAVLLIQSLTPVLICTYLWQNRTTVLEGLQFSGYLLRMHSSMEIGA